MAKKDLLKLKKFILLSSMGLCLSGLNNKNVQAKNIDTVFKINLSEIMRQEEISKPKNNTELVDYYAKVYKMVPETVEKIIKKLTDNYNAYPFDKYHVINGKKYDSSEFAILMTIDDIYENTENYANYITEDEYNNIKNGEEYESLLTHEEMIEKYSNLFQIKKEIPLCISYAECFTDMSSENYLENNNPAGLGPYMYFNNKECGVIYFIWLLKYRYGITMDSDEYSLERIAPTYCETPNDWLELTKPIFYKLEEDYNYYAPKKEILTLK